MAGRSGGDVLGAIGRVGMRASTRPRAGLTHVSSIWHMLVSSLYYAAIAPMTGKSRLRRQLWPLMRNVGVRSFAIVALVNLLTGAILVLQTGDVMERMRARFEFAKGSAVP